jgi:UDP-N-acetylglucosamine:LPS N-acetylglucosamine transferase
MIDMKISILTGNFGMGHKSAALAIQQQLEDSNLEADIEITDWFHYVSPKLSDKFYRLYTVLINKGSRFYNARYRFLENKKTDQKPELNHYFQWYFSKFIKEKRPDLIISTLPFCSQIVSI